MTDQYSSVERKTDVRQGDSQHMNLRVLGWSIGGVVVTLALFATVIVFSI